MTSASVILLCSLAILAGSQLPVEGHRILGLFPLNGKSHWVMMEPLMKALAKKGHQVDVVTHFPQKKPFPNYRDISLEGTLPAVMNNMSASDIGRFGNFVIKNLVSIAGDRCCELMYTPQMMELIKNPPTDPPYDLVITELFAAPCFLAFGHKYKVPTVGVLTCAFHDWLNYYVGNPINTAITPNLFSTFTTKMNFWERLMNTVMTTYMSQQMNYYTGLQDRYVKDVFGEDMPHVLDLYQELALLLVNSHHSLNGIRPYTPAVVNVAGLHLKEVDDPLPPPVQKWLDEAKHGCVYFTFGSMVRIETFPNETIHAFYEAFRRLAPVRILMKVPRTEDLLPGLPENVMTQQWFPQVSVLRHKNVKAFLTHGGLMGTQEAIYCGVPMVGIPLFGDQRVNINVYVNHKIAISLESVNDVTADKLYNALHTVIHDPSYRENMKKLSTLFMDRQVNPTDTAVYWVEYVLKYGNVLQSPALQLNWFQRNLLDVYGFILAVAGVVLLVAYFILRKLMCMICSRICSGACGKKNVPKSKKNK